MLPGDYIGKATPVPIPNTVVKLFEPMIVRARAKVGIAGIFKNALEELVPAYLATVPEDPFSGQPLRYRLEGTAFVLYSVGQDQQDDGGKPGTHRQSMFEFGYDLDIDTMLRPDP